MAKEEMVQFEGVIDEVLPNTIFRVALKNGCTVMAYASGKIRKYRIRILVGDRVTIEMSPYDLTKGRITFRAQGGTRLRSTHSHRTQAFDSSNASESQDLQESVTCP